MSYKLDIFGMEYIILVSIYFSQMWFFYPFLVGFQVIWRSRFFFSITLHAHIMHACTSVGSYTVQSCYVFRSYFLYFKCNDDVQWRGVFAKTNVMLFWKKIIEERVWERVIDLIIIICAVRDFWNVGRKTCAVRKLHFLLPFLFFHNYKSNICCEVSTLQEVP